MAHVRNQNWRIRVLSRGRNRIKPNQAKYNEETDLQRNPLTQIASSTSIRVCVLRVPFNLCASSSWLVPFLPDVVRFLFSVCSLRVRVLLAANLSNFWTRARSRQGRFPADSATFIFVISVHVWLSVGAAQFGPALDATSFMFAFSSRLPTLLDARYLIRTVTICLNAFFRFAFFVWVCYFYCSLSTLRSAIPHRSPIFQRTIFQCASVWSVATFVDVVTAVSAVDGDYMVVDFRFIRSFISMYKIHFYLKPFKIKNKEKFPEQWLCCSARRHT